MLKSNYKTEKISTNLITNSLVDLGEDIAVEGKGKGRKFISRFIEPGVAHYEEFGDVLITKETLNKFIHTMIGCPVIIKHKDIDDKNADKERVGVISNVWFNEADGWYYCDGIIWDKQAIDLVKNQGWNVSCTYDFESDKQPKTHNGKKIDMEFTNGEFLHLALVDNPRYERANITVMNSQDEKEEKQPENIKDTVLDAISEVVTNCLGECRNWSKENFDESKVKRDGGKFAKQIEGSKKEIKPYIPHFERKPNPNFKYDDAKIKTLIADIESENINSDDIPIFKDTKKLENWLMPIFENNRTVKIISDGEEILLSKNSAQRAARKQDPDDKELNAVFNKIKNILEKSKYYDFEPKNEEHEKKRILGQYVYFSKIKIDNQPYRVRFKIDVPQDEDGALVYAGHRLKKI